MVGAILLLEIDRITAPVPVYGLARNSRLATALTLRIYICGKVHLDRAVTEIDSYRWLDGSTKVHAKEIYVLEMPIGVGGVHGERLPIYHSVEWTGGDLMFKEELASLESVVSGYKRSVQGLHIPPRTDR